MGCWPFPSLPHLPWGDAFGAVARASTDVSVLAGYTSTTHAIQRVKSLLPRTLKFSHAASLLALHLPGALNTL